MKDEKFEKGDRVRLARNNDYTFIKIGMKGTVRQPIGSEHLIYWDDLKANYNVLKKDLELIEEEMAGDHVVCVDNKRWETHLTIGKQYKVTHLRQDIREIGIVDDMGYIRSWDEKRFKKVNKQEGCHFCGTGDGSHSAECIDTNGKGYYNKKQEEVKMLPVIIEVYPTNTKDADLVQKWWAEDLRNEFLAIVFLTSPKVQEALLASAKAKEEALKEK